jgi:hypothetical protein
VTAAALRYGDNPVRGFVAGGTVPLDRIVLRGFWQLAFVDQERSIFGTTLTLENVGWHAIVS